MKNSALKGIDYMDILEKRKNLEYLVIILIRTIL